MAVADTGLGDGTEAGAHPDIPASRISTIYSPPPQTISCITGVDEGAADLDSGHGTHVAVSVLGDGGPSDEGKGIAPGANLVFQAVEYYLKFKKSIFCAGYTDGYYLAGIPYDLRDLFQQAYDDGARIHTNSWGSLGLGFYTIDSGNTDDFIWNNPDMTILFAAGNEGHDWVPFDGEIDICRPGTTSILICLMASPATAKNVITVGASENSRVNYSCDPGQPGCDGANSIITYGEFMGLGPPVEGEPPSFYNDPMAGNAEQMAAFSSRGPTYDGRIKPDVVAPGTWVLSGYSSMYQDYYGTETNPQNGAFQYDGWGNPYSTDYKFMGGTSMATPLVAGAAAVVRDYYNAQGHEASAALVKATLINTAVDLLDENNDGVNDNAYPIPNGHEGWGRVDLDNATDGSHQYREATDGLATGDTDSYQFEVEAGSSAPFKVSLVWSDHPATDFVEVFIIIGEEIILLDVSPGPNLVNDLDLKVIPPSGASYLGNNFSGGWTQTGGSADRLNNVENVYVANPSDGTWTVEVRGFNVPNGPQPYALVIDGVEVTPTPTPDTELPIVTDIIPDGSESLTVGTEYPITWSATDNVGVTSVDLSYSQDGVNFTAIASGESYDGTYNWMPPSAMPEAYIKVMAHDAAGNTGEGISDVFSIVDGGGGGPTETVTITKATYNSRKNKGTLEIQATSSLGGPPATALKATYVEGGENSLPVSMDYSGKKKKWSKKITGVSEKPISVEVCSSSGVCVATNSIGGK